MSIQSFSANDGIEEIIQKYREMIYGIALTHVRNRSDADDVFQEVFLVYFKKEKTFNEEEHRKAWLINTTLNCCKKITGSTWLKKTAPYEALPEEVFHFSTQEESLIYIALRELPVKYRTVLHLFYYEDMSVEEIGRALKTKAGTVRVQLKRGRQMMREKLEGEYFNE